MGQKGTIPERPTFGSHILLPVNSVYRCFMYHYYMFVIVGPIYSFYYGHGMFILFILNLLLKIVATISF